MRTTVNVFVVQIAIQFKDTSYKKKKHYIDLKIKINVTNHINVVQIKNYVCDILFFVIGI